MKKLYSILCSLSLLFLVSCSQQQINPAWKSDLEYVKSEMLNKDIGLITNSARSEDFTHAIDQILSNLPKYDNDDQIFVDLSRAIASIGQLHTALQLKNEDVLPFNFYMEQGDLYVTGAVPAYTDTFFMKLTKIDDTPAPEIIQKLEGVISHENIQGLQSKVPTYILYPSILHGLDIVTDKQHMELTFQHKASQETKVSVQPVSPEQYMAGLQIPHVGNPYYDKFRGSNYGLEYLAADKALYIAYNVCAEDAAYSLQAFQEDIRTAIRSETVGKVIIDLRANPGGDSRVLDPLIEELSSINRLHKNVYVLIGRNTASSAIINAISLQASLEAVLVGEPTESSPNSAGEILPLALPDTGFMISYSTKEFHLSDTTADALLPDIPVAFTMGDYERGSDPVLGRALEEE
ncbi:hypothetical protein MHI24_10315 [Paenibacillus sp. FSL K6-1096]|uniref:hypothetical protein n=1 Tax=Paenibacillus sp. FSL K6-1096 TaxID=2921460 RepID=UPI0030EC8CC7